MDGLESRRSVFVIAATNRPELIDPAMLRPGRLDKRLYVPLPCATERASILAAVARKTKVAPSLDLAAIAADPRCDGFSGADIAALLREAGLAVLRALPRPSALDRHTKAPKLETVGDGSASAIAAAQAGKGGGVRMEIGAEHFESALCKVRPSVSKADRDRYARMRDELEGN